MFIRCKHCGHTASTSSIRCQQCGKDPQSKPADSVALLSTWGRSHDPR